MAATGEYSLKAYLRDLEWWYQTLGSDVTPAQRTRAILFGLRGEAYGMFSRMTAGEFLQGTVVNGVQLTPVQYITARLAEHFGDNDEEMRRRVDKKFLHFEVRHREMYEEFVTRYERERQYQEAEGLREWRWEEHSRRILQLSAFPAFVRDKVLTAIQYKFPATQAEYHRMLQVCRTLYRMHLDDNNQTIMADVMRGQDYELVPRASTRGQNSRDNYLLQVESANQWSMYDSDAGVSTWQQYPASFGASSSSQASAAGQSISFEARPKSATFYSTPLSQDEYDDAVSVFMVADTLGDSSVAPGYEEESSSATSSDYGEDFSPVQDDPVSLEKLWFQYRKAKKQWRRANGNKPVRKYRRGLRFHRFHRARTTHRPHARKAYVEVARFEPDEQVAYESVLAVMGKGKGKGKSKGKGKRLWTPEESPR